MEKDRACQIFQRHEEKYLLSEEQYQSLMEKLEVHIVPDDFFQSTICNIYYDTPDYLLARNSLEKPVYKEKLRLRSYGVPKPNDRVFLEIKKKYEGIVYKRRVMMTLFEAQSYLTNGLYGGEKSQILKEIDWFWQFYKSLAPRVYLSYDRLAYQFLEDPQMRVTFDENIRWRAQQLQLDAGTYGSELLPSNLHLMELKIARTMPLWLVRTFEELGIRQTSFSKYGSVYENYLLKNVTCGGGKKYA